MVYIYIWPNFKTSKRESLNVLFCNYMSQASGAEKSQKPYVRKVFGPRTWRKRYVRKHLVLHTRSHAAWRSSCFLRNRSHAAWRSNRSAPLGVTSASVGSRNIKKAFKNNGLAHLVGTFLEAPNWTMKIRKAFPCSVSFVPFCAGAFPCSVALVF